MAIGEVFLGALITVLFEKLASREVLNFARREGIESQLNNWSYMLLKIQAVLADAEERQIREDSPVNLWLQSLRDLAYDVDDLLDEIAYDALAKIGGSSAQGEANTVAECISAWNPWVVISNSRNESKIKLITDRFEDIVTRQDLLRLSDCPSGSVGRVGNYDDRSTSCVVDEPAVFGREKDKETIVQLLLQGRGQVGVGVLPIVGMGGLGKTTLAQLVYNDSTVEDYFHVRAWTCVSDQFDVIRITRSILESLKLVPRGTDLNSLQVQLKEALSLKKFLIILDDVWNENYRAWDSLRAPLSLGLSGSMIIVTTRNEDVASLVGNVSPFRLMQLSDDICLSIFLLHALGVPSFQAHQSLTDIGIQIAKRCKGLPLAAKMLGGILRNKERPKQWHDILESEIWDLPESGILPVLKLSYHHLPSHLKRCFAYCSLFPADYKFDKHDLILLWMAEGFLQQRSNQKKQMEELGSDYFDNLTSRSFFQPSNTSSLTFVMHDLIHDLARHVASNAYLHVDNPNAISQDTVLRVRHSSFVRGEYDTFERLEAFGDMNSLRTFLALPIEKRPPQSFLSSKMLLYLLQKVTRLRVICLCGYWIKELPDKIGQLKHLRYLNMTDTNIIKLPESVTSLIYLLTLILRGCGNLRELPSSIGNLVNLQYLDLDDTPNLLQMPSEIKTLTGLRRLSKFVVGKKDGLGISDLKNFSSLGGNLSITCLHNVVDISGAIHASLNSKDGLEELRMEWKNEFDDSRDEEIERQVLHHLQPPKSVQKLDIFYYGGNQLPCWIGDPLCAPNMVRLRIDGCKNVTSLPPLGRLPLLKELILTGLDGVTSIGAELYGYDDPLTVDKAFPSLERLSIFHMLRWEEWSGSSGLNVLRTLVVMNCRRLMGKLPSHLPSLKELKIHECPRLIGKLPCHLPSIEKLQIWSCPQLTTIPLATSSLASLNDLHLDRCVIGQGSMQVRLSSLTKLRIVCISDLCSLNILNSLPSLHELRIECCQRLMSFGEMSLPSTLKSLKLQGCEALETLPLMHAECFLEDLHILHCNSLESFPVVKEAESSKFDWRVKSLQISDNCELLKEITVHGIESLSIFYCQSLMCFPARDKKLPSSLKSLHIDSCENLHTLTEGMLIQDNSMSLSLEAICIERCPSLACFSTVGKLPTSLKRLRIVECSELAAIPGAMPGSSLEEIDINSCPNLQEFPESLVQYNTPSLKKVTVSNCKNLRSLPNQINSLTNLVKLDIDGCPAVRLSSNQQAGGLGFPLNITSLTMGRELLHGMDMCKWGLDNLTSLKSLRINGKGMDEVISFPEYGDGNRDKCFLPASITYLSIYDFNNLESLSNGLQNLIFLKRLLISRCPNLRYLPSEGLPPTLEELEFLKSPVLGERCKKDGDYWPVIFHIPYVRIDEKAQ